MPQFTDKEQDGMEVLVRAAENLQHALRLAAKVGIGLQVKYRNLQLPSHLDVLATAPMRVGAEGLWVDIKTKPEPES